jgi:hypothetical protein
MNKKQREKIIKEANKRRQSIMTNKGSEYSKGDDDINYNFKEVAKRLGTRLAGTPEYVCLVYLEKHLLSIEKWAKDGKLSSGETIISRLDDIRNYFDILESLTKEENTKFVIHTDDDNWETIYTDKDVNIT